MNANDQKPGQQGGQQNQGGGGGQGGQQGGGQQKPGRPAGRPGWTTPRRPAGPALTSCTARNSPGPGRGFFHHGERLIARWKLRPLVSSRDLIASDDAGLTLTLENVL